MIAIVRSHVLVDVNAIMGDSDGYSEDSAALSSRSDRTGNCNFDFFFDTPASAVSAEAGVSKKKSELQFPVRSLRSWFRSWFRDVEHGVILVVSLASPAWPRCGVIITADDF